MWLVLLLACDKAGEDSDPLETGTQTTDSTEPTDDTQTTPTDDTGLTTTPSEFELSERDEEIWGQINYVVEEWVDTTGVLGADGVAPSLTWLRPAAEGPVSGVLLYLHGSTAADDSTTPCDTEVAEVARARFLTGWGPAVYFASERNFAILAPINRWCDVWMGLGPHDPVDTGHHGWSFIDRGLDWALSTHSGVAVDGPVVAWGTSTGSIGAGLALARREEVIGAVVDSGPIDLEDRTQQDFAATLVHILGGGPDKVPDRYRENSIVALVEDGLLTKPIFAATNNRDEITAAVHGENLLAALEAAYTPSGLRFGWHDFNHAAPGDTHHVQTGLRPMPWTYVTPLVMAFMVDGERLSWSEAEAACDRCDIGRRILDGDWANTASGGAVIGALESDGAGVAMSLAPPAQAAGQAMAATAVIGLGELTAPMDSGEIVATVRWTVNELMVAEQTLRFGDMANGDNLRDAAGQIELSTLALPGGFTEADTRFEVWSAGSSPLLIDAAVFRW